MDSLRPCYHHCGSGVRATSPRGPWLCWLWRWWRCFCGDIDQHGEVALIRQISPPSVRYGLFSWFMCDSYMIWSFVECETYLFLIQTCCSVTIVIDCCRCVTKAITSNIFMNNEVIEWKLVQIFSFSLTKPRNELVITTGLNFFFKGQTDFNSVSLLAFFQPIIAGKCRRRRRRHIKP